MAPKVLHCYAHGHGDSWEAICTDLDIAVQGKSLADVRETMRAAIFAYVEAAHAEAPDVEKQLLSRRAPWYVRARVHLGLLCYQVCSHFNRRDGDTLSNFNVPCPA